MEKAVDNLENQMLKTEKKLDNIAKVVKNVEDEIGGQNAEEVSQLDVNHLLQSVKSVKDDYQNLRNDISEVHGLQKQLSNTLELKVQLLQLKCNSLKEKLALNVPHRLPGVPKIKLQTSTQPAKMYDDK